MSNVIITNDQSIVVIPESQSTIVIEPQSPANIVISPIGVQGTKGDSGEGVRRYFFSYGDSSPKILDTVSGLVSTVSLIILVPFNGVNPSLKIGDSIVKDRLMNVNQNLPSIVAEFQTNPCYLYGVNTQILLTIDPGSGATQGNGYIILEV